MIRKLVGTLSLLACLASGARAGSGLQQGLPVTIEPRKTVQAAGPGERPFDVSRHAIPLSEIAYSIPRDAIPALVEPRFITADQARSELKDSDRVLGVLLKGEAKAYPVRILNWHELVNDVVGGQPILVSW